jgi:Skp family chaperone for outer membrane proteins
MIRNNLFTLSAFFVLLVGSSALAQRPATPAASPTQRPAAPTTTAAQQPPATANVALPPSKVALIYTSNFLDSKGGIAKFNSVLTKLNGEFQKQKDDITQLQTRGQTLQDEITKLQQAPAGTPIDQRSLQAKVDQVEQLKKDIQRKTEDAQASYNRRRTELFKPLEDEVGKALEAFAKARGINVILDGDQLPLVYAAPSLDITAAFIAEFNSKNPVTASTTPPE